MNAQGPAPAALVTVISWFYLDANSQGEVIPLLKKHWRHVHAKVPPNILKIAWKDQDTDIINSAHPPPHTHTHAWWQASKCLGHKSSDNGLWRKPGAMSINLGRWAHRTKEAGWSLHSLTAPWLWNLQRSISSLSFESAAMTQKDKKRDTVAGINHLTY